MARNWLRHHVGTQDGQAVIRKIVVCPAHEPAGPVCDLPADSSSQSDVRSNQTDRDPRTLLINRIVEHDRQRR